jgi:teichuronic acid biosynthesis glycosyltransferase TuaC
MPDAPLRVLVVSNMYPSVTAPAYGVFVRAQVEALRAIDGIEVQVMHWDARRRPWIYGMAALELKLKNITADVVHAHYGLSGFVALAAPRRIPLVLTVHGRDCHHPVVRRLTKLAAARAATVVAVSDELAGQCPFAVDEVLPPGVDLELFKPLGRAASRQKLGLGPGKRLLLFPSDPRRPEKRYADAAALAAALPDVELVSLTGRPRLEVPLWINAADAVVVPSEREGYGLACVEALACDVPVLSTPVGIAPRLLPSVEGCLCAPFALDTWKPAVERILADDDPRIRGRAVAETQSVSATARRLADVYRRLRAS